ncbi:LuxR C-terminal-related transcriptional regulator [Spirillospora sp. NPDC050679]
MVRSDYDHALACLDEAESIAEGEPDSTLLGHVQHATGTTLTLAGRVDAGLAAYREAMTVFEERGFDEPHAVITIILQAVTHSFRGEVAEALACVERCLPMCLERGDRWGEGFARWVGALARWTAGDPGAAVPDLHLCIEAKEEVGDLYHVALAFDLYAFYLTDLGKTGKAALLLGAADALWSRMRAERGPQWESVTQRTVDKLLAAMGRGSFTDASARGATLSAADAVRVMKGERAAPDAPARRSPLTKREEQVARLVAQGLSNRQIAEKLVISKRTADSPLEHILAKLGFMSRAQIAAWAATTDDR